MALMVCSRVLNVAFVAGSVILLTSELGHPASSAGVNGVWGGAGSTAACVGSVVLTGSGAAGSGLAVGCQGISRVRPFGTKARHQQNLLRLGRQAPEPVLEQMVSWFPKCPAPDGFGR